MTEYKCPDCPRTWDSDVKHGVEHALAQHMSLSETHPYTDYWTAREALDDHGLESLRADIEEETPGDADAEESAEGPEPFAGWDPAEDAPGGNPLLRTPVVTDGGADAPECPECDGAMREQDPGQRFSGVLNGDRRVMETSDGDAYCPDCSLVTDGNTVAEDVVPVGGE